MAKDFVLGVDLQVQRVLGLAKVRQELSKVAGTGTGAAGGMAAGPAQAAQGVDKLTQSVTAAAQANAALTQSTANAANGLGTYASKSDAAGTSTGKTAAQMKKGGTAVKNFGDQVFLAGKRYAAFVAATAVAFKGVQGIRDATNFVLEFESAMTRLDQIMDAGSARIGQLEQQFLKLSQATGTSATEIAENAKILAQAGFQGRELDEALEQIAKVPLLPAFESSTQATTGLIAIMRQFKDEGKSTAQIFDVLNEVANNYSVTSQGIIEGVKRGGAAFAAFGGSLEDFIRLFVTIKQTTQLSDSIIGTAIKTISSRVFRPETLRFLQDNHVQVIDELTGKYVGFEQVLRQVAARWDSLSAPRRAEFARQLGGFRQIDKILAAVRNIDLATDIGRTIAVSAGSVDRDVEKALKTTAVQFRQLKEEAKALVAELSDDAILPFLHGLLKLGEAAVFVVDKLGPLIPMIGTLAVAFAGLKTAQYAGALLGRVGGLGAGGLLGPGLSGALFGPMSGTNARERMLARLQGGVGGPSQFTLGGQALTGAGIGAALRANPLIGIAGTAVGGQLAARVLETETAVGLLGETAAKTSANFVSFGTAMLAAIALLRGTSVTGAAKGLFGGTFGGMGGVAVVGGVAAAAYSKAVNDAQEKMIQDAIDGISKFEFHFDDAPLQNELKRFGDRIFGAEGFRQFEDYELLKGKTGADVIGRFALNFGELASDLVTGNLDPIIKSFQGLSLDEQKRAQYVKTVVQENARKIDEALGEAIIQAGGDYRRALIEGLTASGVVSRELAEEFVDEVIKARGGSKGVARFGTGVLAAERQEDTAREYNRITRELQSIAIPIQLNRQLFDLSRAVETTTRSVSTSIDAFDAQIGRYQGGISPGRLTFQPGQRAVQDLIAGGGFESMLRNAPDVRPFVNYIDNLEEMTNQFTRFINTPNLREAAGGDIATTLDYFFKSTTGDVPLIVRDNFRNLFTEVANQVYETTGQSINLDEVGKLVGEEIQRRGGAFKDRVVGNIGAVIEATLAQAQRDVSAFAQIQRMRLNAAVTPESQARFLTQALGEAGIGGGAQPEFFARHMGTLEDLLRRQRDFGLQYMPAPREGFYEDRRAALQRMATDPGIRARLEREFVQTADALVEARPRLGKLAVGKLGFQGAVEEVKELEKQSVRLQTAMEALGRATEQARQYEIDRLQLQRKVELRQYEERVRQQIATGRPPSLTQIERGREAIEYKYADRMDAVADKYDGYVEKNNQLQLQAVERLEAATRSQNEVYDVFRGSVGGFQDSVLTFGDFVRELKGARAIGAVPTVPQPGAPVVPTGAAVPPPVAGPTPEQARQFITTPEELAAGRGMPTATPQAQPQVSPGSPELEASLKELNDGIRGGDVQRDQVVNLLDQLLQETSRGAEARQGLSQTITDTGERPVKANLEEAEALQQSMADLRASIQEPGNVKLTASQNLNIDIRGLENLAAEFGPSFAEIAQRIAEAVVRDALRSIAGNSDLDTQVAINETINSRFA